MTGISRLIGAAALVGGLAAAGAGAAQPGPAGGPHGGFPPRAPIDFKAIDTDGNGSLSRGELMARATARLTPLDTSGDGSLDRAELIAAMPVPPNAVIEVFSVSPAEAMVDRMLALSGGTETGSVTIDTLAAARVNRLLALVDTDHDAAISLAEAEAVPPGPRPHRHHMGGAWGRMGPHGPGGPGSPDGPPPPPDGGTPDE